MVPFTMTCIWHMRKLFLAMSAESEGQPNRYLAPWSIFESEDESRRRESIMKILKDPLRIGSIHTIIAI